MVSPLPSIVTLIQAKAAAKITTFEEDQILYALLETAHEWVLDHLNNQIDDSSDAWLDTILAWDESNAPKRVKAAILHTFIYLQRFRGDDDSKITPAATVSGLPLIAEMMLGRLRDPTVQ